MGENIEVDRDDELDDTTEEFGRLQFDRTVLRNPTVIRLIGSVLIGMGFLVWPDRSDRILARLLGVVLLWLGVTWTTRVARTKPTSWSLLPVALIAVVLGGFLVVWPDQSPVVLARLIGLWLLIVAARIIVGELRSKDRTAAQAATAALLVALGVLLVVATENILSTVFAILAIGWIAVSGLALIALLSPRTAADSSNVGSAQLIKAWLEERPKSVERRQELYDKILYEGPQRFTRVVRFFVLMGFASVIASMGVITNSTAVVIGAMLVAPLMTPLMGMAISLVMGWPNRLSSSVAVAFGGIGFAISIGLFLGLTVPAVIDTTTNAQILARTSPTILDLIIAVAAGAAGAYGLSRPDVSDSLPGVAIAISLVPPLAVVGICYSQGDWRAGNGALLLFATNMSAILVVGGITFVFTGVTPVARVTENQNRVQTALTVTAAAALTVLGGLFLNGEQVASNAFAQSTVQRVATGWLPEDSGHRLISAEIDGDVVTAVVVGPSGPLPDPQLLADEMKSELGRPISVEVSHIVEESLTASSGDS